MSKKKVYNNLLEWLHEVTIQGYQRGIFIPVELGDDVRSLYDSRTSPERAINSIIGIAHVKGISINKEV